MKTSNAGTQPSSHASPREYTPLEHHQTEIIHQNNNNNNETTPSTPPPALNAKQNLHNFILLSFLFSANHGGVVSCLSLAIPRLGSAGAAQSATLYIVYTLSSILGATYVVKRLGARNALVTGMSVYCVYIGCFVIAAAIPTAKEPVAILGGLIGGLGAGFLWTAQGSYFARAATEYAIAKDIPTSDATSLFGGIFAGIYLALEVVMRLLSTVLLEAAGFSWIGIFATYTIIAVISAVGMCLVYNYQSTQEEERHNAAFRPFEKMTVALRLLWTDRKMKFMIPLNAVFGFAASFVGSYVSGEVLRIALQDTQSAYVGVLTSITSAVAAIMSVAFGYVDQCVGKGPVLVVGSVCFFLVGFLFAVNPAAETWGIGGLIAIYSLQGIGRATFEGTLRAEFADFFAEEKEGAFANIVLQNGLSSAIGYFLSIYWYCPTEGTYCVKFTDGTLHNVLVFELLVMITAVLSVFGYWKASSLFADEKEQRTTNERTPLNDVEDTPSFT